MTTANNQTQGFHHQFFKHVGIFLVLLGGLLVADAAIASEKNVTHHIDLAGIERIDIHNGVGTVHIRRSQGDQAELKVRFEGKRSGLMRRIKDVSDMDVEIRTRGDRLSISFQENNVEATMYITLPDPAVLDIHVGVGVIDAEVGESSVSASMGVGDVTIRGFLDYAGEINVDAGVGAARIDGAQNVSSSRAIVSEKASGRGEGTFRIKADVGVGDVKVVLK
ncbi:hypothetical protein FM042_01130 [Aliidiomarina halalkaliphila]|uniref:Adhesin domain-containing protein n=1 Tax=Aliidiomarina halalkaliphila TaxID=2593535 RepID=A0A552X378_9GAMM|nr:hypothetical protein [Aliidiomarina halalkaliphila]TRW49498.1 hypothetical protein FM042_01130 [Aliidiomarina halalkaliphila]